METQQGFTSLFCFCRSGDRGLWSQLLHQAAGRPYPGHSTLWSLMFFIYKMRKLDLSTTPRLSPSKRFDSVARCQGQIPGLQLQVFFHDNGSLGTGTPPFTAFEEGRRECCRCSSSGIGGLGPVADPHVSYFFFFQAQEVIVTF